jgi:hypothetical protein
VRGGALRRAGQPGTPGGDCPSRSRAGRDLNAVWAELAAQAGVEVGRALVLMNATMCMIRGMSEGVRSGGRGSPELPAEIVLPEVEQGAKVSRVVLDRGPAMSTILFQNAALLDGTAEGALADHHVLVEGGLIREVSDTPGGDCPSRSRAGRESKPGRP